MGVVEDGCVSGVLPAQKLFAVHYPGYPSSLTRAVETLGGREALVKARESEGNFLELRFRPEDPCAHPTFGEASATSNLLLRISRTASRADGGAESGEERVEVRADVVGLVEHEYSFDGMADYQYVLGVHAAAARGSKKRRGEGDGEEGVQDVDMMMIVPPLFSLKDMPDNVVLRPVEFTRLRTVAQQPSREPSVLVQQAVFGGKVLGLDFKSKEIPPEINWEERLEKGTDEHFCQSTLGRLFRGRPIWSKPRLLEKLEEEGVVLNGSQVKRLFLRTAYCFGYGPYRMTWIRNGYDPRSDPESRKYQIMDYRVPLIVRKPNVEEYVRRDKKESEPAWKDMCMFKVAPRKKFSFFQLCDLEDDFIQAEIKKPAERATCGASTGWFKRGTLEKLRLHVRLRFLRLIPGEVARAVEAAELKSLQRVRFQPVAPDDGTLLSTDRLRVPPRRRDVASHLPNASSFHPDLTLGDHPFYEDLRVKNGFLPSQKTRGPLNEASPSGDEALPLEETEDNDEEDEDEDEDELNDEEEDEAVDEVDDHFEEEEEEEEEEEMEDEEETMASRAVAGFRDMGMESMSNSYLQSLLEEFSDKGDAQQRAVGGEDVEEYAIFDQDDDDDVDDDY